MGYQPRKSRAAYQTPYYKSVKKTLMEGWFECWVTDDFGKCHRRGTTPDHCPPLATVGDPMNWAGVLRPMCSYHSVRQAGKIMHGRNYVPKATRQW